MSVLKWQTCDFMSVCCVLCRELCSVHFKSDVLNCKMCVKQKMCLKFWRLEKRFCSLCVSLNICATHVILVCWQLKKTVRLVLWLRVEVGRTYTQPDRKPGAKTAPEQQLQPESSEFSDDTNTTVNMVAVLTGNMCFVAI